MCTVKKSHILYSKIHIPRFSVVWLAMVGRQCQHIQSHHGRIGMKSGCLMHCRKFLALSITLEELTLILLFPWIHARDGIEKITCRYKSRISRNYSLVTDNSLEKWLWSGGIFEVHFYTGCLGEQANLASTFPVLSEGTKKSNCICERKT